MRAIEEIEITLDTKEDEVFAISLVHNPAMEDRFIFLSKGEKVELKVIDEDRRIVVGYAMIPEKRIYRKHGDKECNIFFSSDTIKEIAEKFMIRLNVNNVTTDHKNKIQGASVIESWITEDETHDKINLYGIAPKVGSWALMMKIYDDKEWESIKDGTYQGYSIEGGFEKYRQFFASKQNDLHQELRDLFIQISNG